MAKYGLHLESKIENLLFTFLKIVLYNEIVRTEIIGGFVGFLLRERENKDMNKTETEKLLETINLSMDDIYNIAKLGVAQRYKNITKLWNYNTVDDTVQDVITYYLSTMESTGDIRLNYYIKKYQNREHIVNLIKQTSYQLPLRYLKRKELTHLPLSLDITVEETSNKTLLDTIIDPKGEYDFNTIETKDFIESVLRELDNINYDRVRKLYSKYFAKRSLLLNVNTYLYVYSKAQDKTDKQLDIIMDLYSGKAVKELQEKYQNFRAEYKIIKDAVKKVLLDSGCPYTSLKRSKN